jgi:tyrosine-protein kinase Etk/Wzc
MAMEVEPIYELTLRDYVRIIRKRKYILIFSIVIVCGFAYWWTKKQLPIYQTSSTVELVQQYFRRPGVLGFLYFREGDIFINAIKKITSPEIAKEVAKRLNKPIDEIQGKYKAEKIADTNLIEISVSSHNPIEVKQIADTVAEVFVETAIRDGNIALENACKLIEKNLAKAKQELEIAEDKLKEFRKQGKVTGVGEVLTTQLFELQSKLSELKEIEKYTDEHPEVIKLTRKIKEIEKKLNALPSADFELSKLVREVKIKEQEYLSLIDKNNQAQIEKASAIPAASIVSYANEPISPSAPNLTINMILGIIVGIILGTSLVFVREHFDTSIGTIEEVESFIQLPVLGIIPRIAPYKKGIKYNKKYSRKVNDVINKLIIFKKNKSKYEDAYHNLRIKIQSALLKDKNYAVLITSAGPDEGKSITAINLGLSIADSGAKTLIIDADLRRPVIYKLLGLSKENGLTDIIQGKISFLDAIKGIDQIIGNFPTDEIIKTLKLDNLHIITPGSLPLIPIDYFSSEEFDSIIKLAKSYFDIIIFDSAPLLHFADSIIIGKKIDGCVIVFKVGATPRDAIKRAKQELENANVKVLGVVLNDVKRYEMKPEYGYYYRPYYYYKKYTEERK